MAFDLDDVNMTEEEYQEAKYQRIVNKVKAKVIEDLMAWMKGEGYLWTGDMVKRWAIKQGILGEPTTPCIDESGFSAGAGVKEG